MHLRRTEPVSVVGAAIATFALGVAFAAGVCAQASQGTDGGGLGARQRIVPEQLKQSTGGDPQVQWRSRDRDTGRERAITVPCCP